MHIVHVYFHVKPEHIEDFIKASMENAKNSREETGVIRFDVLQRQDDSTLLMFVEIYKTPDDQLKHRETEHFKKWRQLIGDMLEEQYTAQKYHSVY